MKITIKRLFYDVKGLNVPGPFPAGSLDMIPAELRR